MYWLRPHVITLSTSGSITSINYYLDGSNILSNQSTYAWSSSQGTFPGTASTTNVRTETVPDAYIGYGDETGYTGNWQGSFKYFRIWNGTTITANQISTLNNHKNNINNGFFYLQRYFRKQIC